MKMKQISVLASVLATSVVTACGTDNQESQVHTVAQKAGPCLITAAAKPIPSELEQEQLQAELLAKVDPVLREDVVMVSGCNGTTQIAPEYLDQL